MIENCICGEEGNGRFHSLQCISVNSLLAVVGLAKELAVIVIARPQTVIKLRNVKKAWSANNTRKPYFLLGIRIADQTLCIGHSIDDGETHCSHSGSAFG